MNKALPWIVGGSTILAAVLLLRGRKASAGVPIPAPVPKGPVTPSAPPAATKPPTLAGYVPFAECDPGGNLGAWDDLRVKQMIDDATDPDVIESLANQLMTGVPPCLVRSAYARKKAADMRGTASVPEPAMGGLQY